MANNTIALQNGKYNAVNNSVSHEFITHIRNSVRKWWLLPFFLLLGILFVWPLIMMVIGGFKTDAPFLPGEWTFKAWEDAFKNPGLLNAVLTSLKISFISTIASILIAAIFAFVTEKTDLKVGAFVMPAMVLIFITPFLFYTIAFTQLANPYTGILNDALRYVFGYSPKWLNANGWFGIYSVMILKKVAFGYMFLVGAFRALDAGQDEASYMSGAGQVRTFFNINLPGLLPAITSITILGLIAGLQVFEPILILGSSQKIVVISTLLMSMVSGVTGLPQYGQAAILSSFFVVFVTVLYLIQIKAIGKKNYYSIGGKGARVRKVRLSSLSKIIFTTLISLYLLVAFILPMGALFFSSFQRFPGVYDGLSLNSYVELLKQPRIFSAFKVTLVLGFVVGFLVMLLALLLSVIGQKLKPRSWAAVKFITLIPLAMPGVISTIAITWAYLSVPGLSHLYGSIWLIGLALIVTAMPIAGQLMNSVNSQVSPSLSEAARVCGASSTQAFFEIVLVLVLPSFIAGWLMTAVMVAGNLEVPLLLKSPGLNTLAIVSYNIQSAGDYSMASALLVLIILFSLSLWAISKLLQLAFKATKQNQAQFKTGLK